MATCKNTPLAWRVVLAGLLLLHASGERIEDNGLYTDCVADKPNCKSLSLWQKELSSTIPSEVGLLTELTKLVVGANDVMTGSIPTEVGLLTKLKWLTVYDHKLSGTVPTEVGQLTELTKLVVGGSDVMTGTIPTELREVTKLKWLTLNDMQMTGTVPTILGLLTSLTKLVMGGLPGSDNPGITGTIPTELGLLTALKSVRLSDNSLDGTLPTEFGQLDAVTKLYLYNNTGLCGDLVSVGSVDTSYSCYDADYNTCDGTLNTNLRICCHCDSNNYNNIMRAAISGDTTAMTIALADPIQDIDHMDRSGHVAHELGYNALMLAAQYDHQDVVRMLLDADADTALLTSTDGEEENNWSNVMVAAWYGDEEITKMFLTASTEHLDTGCDYYHMTPLHAAVSRGHSRTTSVLTSFGANVNALDSDGMTPLHYAAKIGHFKCAKTLLTAGADKHLVDVAGNTACAYAAEGVNHDHHHRDIQALLGSCAVAV